MQPHSLLHRALGFFFVIIILWGICILTTNLLHIPSPSKLLGLGLELTPPSKSSSYFDARSISPAPSVRPLTQHPIKLDLLIPWKNGATLSLNEFLKETHTNAIVVLHENKIVYERYFNGYTESSLLPSYSVSKAILATLVGIAIDEKRIASINSDVRPMLPNEIRHQYPYPIRTWDLLNMRAGIAIPETYDSIFSKIAEMYISTDLRRFITSIPSPSGHPGARFEYRSAEYLLLGEVLRQATGQSLSSYLQKSIWHPMGAAYDATWSLDSSTSGIEKAFCCINARASDYARFGLLYLNEGIWNGKRIVPADWIRRTRIPTGYRESLGYSHGWWIPPKSSKDGDFSAIGIYGQYVYINPTKRTVIVKLSDHGAEADEILTLQAFQKISQSIQQKY
ncbi:serine hydrolase domain-containing protein [Deefgea piscis]|nr:serine hydrolase [Deefgea piscis]